MDIILGKTIKPEKIEKPKKKKKKIKKNNLVLNKKLDALTPENNNNNNKEWKEKLEYGTGIEDGKFAQKNEVLDKIDDLNIQNLKDRITKLSDELKDKDLKKNQINYRTKTIKELNDKINKLLEDKKNINKDIDKNYENVINNIKVKKK